MQVSKDTVVSLDYTLKNRQGGLIESTDGSDALKYIHGQGQLLPALESALEGKSSGDSLEIDLKPEEGYGQRDDSMVFTLPNSKFEDQEAVKVGTRFVAKVGDGTRIFKVVDIEGDQVTVDGNHPLAGEALHFDIEIKDVREATEEEIQRTRSD